MTKLLRKDLLILADQWKLSARTLLEAQQYASAFHAGGLALECMLKARIAKTTVAEEFPDRVRANRAWEHDPSKLLSVGALSGALDEAAPPVRSNWGTVKDWTIESRYNLDVNATNVSASSMRSTVLLMGS